MKRVGIVIPVHNTEKFLHQCIDSVVGQSYPETCIVLVNDGSTDKSAAICSEYEKKYSRIKVIHQKNQGKLVARYNGALAADCDYLTYVDSDDWISLTTYERFSNLMENGVDVISWEIIRYFTDDRQIESTHNFPDGLYDSERFRKEIYPYMIWNSQKNTFGIDPSLCNKLIKRDIALRALEKAQGIDIDYGDDVAVTYPLLENIKSFFLSSDPLYYHRQRDYGEYASYLHSDNFYRNLYFLYEYLHKIFRDKQNLICQLDLFYAYSTNLHRIESRKYINNRYIFPFNKVPARKKIILYGASAIGQAYHAQLKALEYAKKILWVDKAYDCYKEFGVNSLDALKNPIGYEYAIIAVKDKRTAEKIREYLSTCLNGFDITIVWSIKSIDDYDR